MIKHQLALVALRNRAITLSVCTTGSATLAATTTGYTRASGSFITDGFVVGQEITPTGFAANTVAIVTAVAALTLTVGTARAAETSAAARTIAVGLPALRAWENLAFTPTAGRWWVEEDYLPGPVAQITLGAYGQVETLPQYVVKLYGVANTSTAALFAMADALLLLFPPRQGIVLSDTNVVIVNTNPAPYRGQLVQSTDGAWAVITITVPCIVRSANSI